jgi:GDP-mannose 6-dehydrogenase
MSLSTGLVQMLPGSVLDLVVPALEGASGKSAGRGFGVAFCPEFLRETTTIRDFYEPPYSVVGVADPRTEGVLRELLAFLAASLHVVDIWPPPRL